MKAVGDTKASFGSVDSGSIKAWTALLIGLAVTLGLVWTVWQGWRLATARWFQDAPVWLLEPTYLGFASIWFAINVAIVLIVRTKRRHGPAMRVTHRQV